QAEDGIRDPLVTGVQTCALPIWKCSRIPAATRATISCPVSNAFGYALVAALGNVVGALAVTRRAARELALIEHFVAFGAGFMLRSEEHTAELQSRVDLVCRLLLE